MWLRQFSPILATLFSNEPINQQGDQQGDMKKSPKMYIAQPIFCQN
jgi:hypothetical protein